MSSGATDYMGSNGSGADFNAYPALAAGSSHTISGFVESKGDHIIVPIGTTWNAAASGNDVQITLSGTESGTILLKNVALGSLDGSEVIVANLVTGPSTSGAIVAASASATGPSFIQAGNSTAGISQFVVGGTSGDVLVGGNGADYYCFAGGQNAGNETIANFSPGKGDAILLGPGTSGTAVASGNDVVVTLANSLGTITLKGVAGELSQIQSSIGTWIQGSSGGGDTVSATGVTLGGSAGYFLQAVNGSGTTTALVAGSGLNEYFAGNSAAGAVEYDFHALTGGEKETVIGFNAGKGDFIHLASGETYALASNSSGGTTVTVTISTGVTSTVVLTGIVESSVLSGWFH